MIDVSLFNEDLAGASEPLPVVTGRYAWESDLLACRACTCRDEATRVVAPFGPLDAEVLVVSQYPDAEEDRAGQPLVGSAGRVFDEWLGVLGLDRSKLAITCAVKCAPKARKPKVHETRVCINSWLSREIAGLDHLKVILLLGQTAFTAYDEKVTMEAAFEPQITRVRHKESGRAMWMVFLPHPTYFARQKARQSEFRTRVLGAVREFFGRDVPDVYARGRRA